MVDSEKRGDPKMNENTTKIETGLDLPILPVLTLPERILNCPLTKFLHRSSSKDETKE